MPPSHEPTMTIGLLGLVCWVHQVYHIIFEASWSNLSNSSNLETGHICISFCISVKLHLGRLQELQPVPHLCHGGCLDDTRPGCSDPNVLLIPCPDGKYHMISFLRRHEIMVFSFRKLHGWVKIPKHSEWQSYGKTMDLRWPHWWFISHEGDLWRLIPMSPMFL